MPIYDFECPHGHRFEHFCSMADRLKETPCEGKVNQLVNDDELEALEGRDELPEGYAWVPIDPDASNGQSQEKVLVKEVPCILKAKLIVTHANPKCMLDHGLASNRDAAREGRYDPLNPNRRFMAKGRSWRK